MSVNCRWPGVWSIRLTIPTRSSGPNSSSSASSVSEQSLGAQVQAVADAQRAGVVEPVDLAGERPGVLAVAGLAAGDQRADPQRVEDGGDPGAGQLGVVGEDRRRLGPAHAGAGLEVALEVVGVELDQAGAEEVAAAGPRPRAARPARRRSPRSGRRGPGRCRSRLSPSSTRRALASASSRCCGMRRSCGMGWLLGGLGDHHGRLAPACNLFRTAARAARWRNSAPTGWAGTRPPAPSAMASTCRGCRGRGPSWSRRRAATASTPR